MKKFAICLAALLVAAMFVPAASAVPTKCYHLTNFCDGVQATQIHVGGIQANEVVGQWDWLCFGIGTGTPTVGGPNKFGTALMYPLGSLYGYGVGIAANFTFKPPIHQFDLYGTFDGATTVALQTAQPFTTTSGPCNPLGPRKPGQKSTTGR